jgi:hypothetical protein
MRVVDKISMLILDIKQKNMVRYLKKNKIINEPYIYHKNNDFQEEVYLDENLKPHFKSVQFKGINISYGEMFIDTNVSNNKFEQISKNEQEIRDINLKLEEIKNSIPTTNLLEKIFGISIKIERDNNDNSN